MEHLSWKAKFDLFQQVQNEGRQSDSFMAFDCDASSTALEKAQVLQFHNGKQVTSNLVEPRNFLDDKCLARCRKSKPDTSDRAKKKPLRCRFAKITCPGPQYDPALLCDWLCSQCLAPVECGFTDEFLYYNCGRVSYRRYDFKYKHENHGPGYESFDVSRLLAHLKKLKQFNYLNILIRGETGVGKSTFINAVVNYLTFETLDQATKEEN